MEGFEPEFTLQTNLKDDLQTKGQTNIEKGNTSSATEEPSDFPKKKTPAKKTAPKKKKLLPLRLCFGNGPIIHKQLAKAYGMAKKRCDDCGKVGNLTCFSTSFRKWALRRVTEEEMNQICSRCKQRGHDCLGCHIPYRLEGTRRKRIIRCGICGQLGHNRRSCFGAV